MQEISQFVSETLEAQTVENETEEEYRQEVADYVRGTPAMASEDLTIDIIEDEMSLGTVAWNDDFVRMEVENGGLGEIEVIRPVGEDELFIGFDLGGMMGGLGGGGLGGNQDGQQYLHADGETLEEQLDLNLPSEDDNEKMLSAIQNGEVYVNGNTVFFDATVPISELDNLQSDSYKQDVETEGVGVTVTYNLDDERLDRLLVTVQNADEPNTHSLKEFLYDVEFTFEVPDVDDENVIEMDDMMGGLMGGLGGGGLGGADNPLGGSIEDVVGGGADLLGGDEDGTSLFD